MCLFYLIYHYLDIAVTDVFCKIKNSHKIMLNIIFDNAIDVILTVFTYYNCNITL